MGGEKVGEGTYRRYGSATPCPQKTGKSFRSRSTASCRGRVVNNYLRGEKMKTNLRQILPQRQECRKDDQARKLKRVRKRSKERDDPSLREPAQHDPPTRPFLLLRRPKLRIVPITPLQSNADGVPLSRPRPCALLLLPALQPSSYIANEQRPLGSDDGVERPHRREERGVVPVRVRVVRKISYVEPRW